jgi:5-methylthioadenosine/S-adenosylhomocysteine deaminase
MSTLEVVGGRVLRPGATVERADVRADRETGEIVAVGDAIGADGETGSDETGSGETDTLDASGCLVIPGLVNAHTHVAMTLLRGYADDEPLDRWLREDVWPVEAELVPADVRAGAELGILEMIRSGTTAFSDMYFHAPEIAGAVEDAGVRARLGHTAITVGKDEEAAHADVEASIEFAREYDGTAGGRVQTSVQPHSLTTVGETHLASLAAGAREHGLPLHYHANETVDEVEPIVGEYGKRPLEYADERGLLEGSAFLAHGVHLDEREIDLLAERGTAVIHCPASNMKLASGTAGIQRLLDAGVEVGIGTDGAASNNDLSMFDELRDAAMLGKLAAADASAVPAATAVEMATAGGARAIGLGSGRIEPGANADFAVVDFDTPHLTPVHDPVSHLAYAVSGSDVRHTVCDGEVLMRDREVLTLDAERVCEEAGERAAALVERAERAK